MAFKLNDDWEFCEDYGYGPLVMNNRIAIMQVSTLLSPLYSPLSSLSPLFILSPLIPISSSQTFVTWTVASTTAGQ